ncbi:hypothetical protein [Pseudomonas sp. SCB32]|nr:hypothetical protein [Pseudomonas sp. SCB32]
MISNGVIGPFSGSVVLAVGYELFNPWVDQLVGAPPASVGQADSAH